MLKVEPSRSHGPLMVVHCRICSVLSLNLHDQVIVLIHFFLTAKVIFTGFYLFAPLSSFPIITFLIQVDVLLSGLQQFWNVLSHHFPPLTVPHRLLLHLLLLPLRRNTHLHCLRYQLKFNLHLFHYPVSLAYSEMIHLQTYRLLKLPSNSNCHSPDTFLI